MRDEGGLVRVGDWDPPEPDIFERLRAYREEDRRTMPYSEYLKTDYWQDLRRRKIRAAGFRCERCRTDRRKLDVHHLTYERRGYELWEDLIVLCRRCHETEHGV